MMRYLTVFRSSSFLAWCCCLPLWAIVAADPVRVEHHFSAHLYSAITAPIATFTRFIGLPLVECFYLFCAALVVVVPYFCWRRYWQQGLNVFVLHTLFLALAWTLCLSLPSLPWLLNMHRLPAEQVFSVTKPLSDRQLVEAKSQLLVLANELARSFDSDDKSCSQLTSGPAHMSDTILVAQARSLESLGLSGIDDAYGGYFGYSAFWSGFGLAGLYVPQIAQANISSLLPDLSQPFVMAHEIAHLNGFATEDAATLAAYHTAFTAGSSALEYSAVLRLLRKMDITEGIANQVQRDLDCIQEQSALIPRYSIRHWYWRFYDRWLRFMGQKQGNRTYAYGEELGLRLFYYLKIRVIS